MYDVGSLKIQTWARWSASHLFISASFFLFTVHFQIQSGKYTKERSMLGPITPRQEICSGLSACTLSV